MEAFATLINWTMVIGSAIGFLVLFFVLRKFLWKAVLDVIDDRRDSIEHAFNEVDEAKDEVVRLKAEYEQKLAEISSEAQAKLQEEVRRGQELAAQIKADAESQREKLLEKTHEDIIREKEKLMAEMRNQAIDLSFAISRRVIRDGMDRKAHDELVESFISEMKELN